MESGEIMDFQIRLQIECNMTDQEAADYIAQAGEGGNHEKISN